MNEMLGSRWPLPPIEPPNEVPMQSHAALIEGQRRAILRPANAFAIVPPRKDRECVVDCASTLGAKDHSKMGSSLRPQPGSEQIERVVAGCRRERQVGRCSISADASAAAENEFVDDGLVGTR